MKYYLLAVLCTLLTLTSLGGNIIYYTNSESGKTVFHIISTSHILQMKYVEEDKVLRVYASRGQVMDKTEFVVRSPEEAIKLIERIYDSNDKSLVELKTK
jgi:hypothetical protein